MLIELGVYAVGAGQTNRSLKRGCLMFADGTAAHRRYEIGVVNLI